MKVKIDTKERFHVITPIESEFTANMTAEIENICLPILRSDIKNVVINMSNITYIDVSEAERLLALQSNFYDNSASFVICCLNKDIENFLDKSTILEIMNTTPSESEAWDIVQMEEIEREFLDDET
ncbi:MAG: hypothetical protein NVS3B19_13450 [Ginsengibacter sp.]